ncbi:hypothetical protein CKF54_03855 [Psittacicella hinzii]|uniref:Uncharacterized protein n=1 Tax=Psittacicella hinzii TaxID=2028575 RepID=A0A3A1Y9X7_9GAMM|nr:methyltransferase [Psittacicella hinzii]RIY32944.1 hypothetical protein CKF54_03855 [Psittacicella hinzii]
MSKLNKIIQRNQAYFQQGEGTLLLGAVDTDLIDEFIELLPAEHKLGIYTKEVYTFFQASQLLKRQGFKIWANLVKEKSSALSKGTEFSLPENLEVNELESLTQAYPLKEKAVYFAYGVDLDVSQTKVNNISEANSDLAHSLTSLPVKIGKAKVNFKQPLTQLLRLTQATNLVVFWPKTKEEFLNLIEEIEAACQNLGLDGENLNVFFIGTNDSGIKTIESLLDNPVRQLDNVARSRLFYAKANLQVSAKLKEKSKHSCFALESGEIVSLPGVFSSDNLDVGTKLLLSTYDDLQAEHNQHLLQLSRTYNKDLNLEVTNPNLNFLDYASGAGVIAQYVANLLQKQIPNPQVNHNWDLIEVYAPALVSSSLNLQNLTARVNFNLQAASAIEQAINNGLEAVFYREIVSNPPFHQGNEVTFKITEDLIAQARKRLHPHGALRLVANNGLPYLPILQQHFNKVKVIAQANGFTVYLAKIS